MITTLTAITALSIFSQTADFTPFPWSDSRPNVRHDRLCPEAAEDSYGLDDIIHINCRLEGEDLREREALPKDTVRVLAYNIERGHELDDQLEVLLEDPDMSKADILLLSELDRGCERTDEMHTARAYARAFDMAYVYGVEFHEVDDSCEHGNAVLSRYPIGNARLIRFESNSDHYLIGGDAGDERVGGRMAIAADIKIGEKLLRVYSTHFASNFFDGNHRREQAREIAADAAHVQHPVVVGGDMNTHLHMFDTISGGILTPVHRAYHRIGLEDAHASRLFFLRSTSSISPLVIDFIFGPAERTSNPGICKRRKCKDLSDHLPIWADIDIS